MFLELSLNYVSFYFGFFYELNPIHLWNATEKSGVTIKIAFQEAFSIILYILFQDPQEDQKVVASTTI